MKDHDKVMIEVTPSQIEYQLSQIEEIVAFFVARDEMNARVHLGDVRYSPITERAMELSDYVRAMWLESTATLAKQ